MRLVAGSKSVTNFSGTSIERKENLKRLVKLRVLYFFRNVEIILTYG